MDLRQLEYLLTIAEYRNITKAAEALYISQSALSHYVQKVEAELGVRIFDRSTNPISLTQAGECYMNSARKILMENDRLSKELRDITQHMTGKLRIGTSRDRAGYIMPRLMTEFGKAFPGIEVEVLTDSGRKLRESLRLGQVDLLLLPSTKADDDHGLEKQLLYTEELVFVAKKGWLREEMLETPRSVRPDALDGLPHFAMFQDHACRAFCDNFFKTNHIHPDIKMQFSSNIICYYMAAEGLGFTIVPYLITQTTHPSPDTELLSLGKVPAAWDVCMFYRKDAYLGSPEQTMIDIAKRICSNERLNA